MSKNYGKYTQILRGIFKSLFQHFFINLSKNRNDTMKKLIIFLFLTSVSQLTFAQSKAEKRQAAGNSRTYWRGVKRRLFPRWRPHRRGSMGQNRKNLGYSVNSGMRHFNELQNQAPPALRHPECRSRAGLS